MKIISFCSRHICLPLLALGLTASPAILSPALAQTVPTFPPELAGVVPLADQTMGHISGMGLVLAKAGTQSPGTGNVVLWDEVARNPRVAPKSIPGFSVTVNGVPQ